MLQPERPKTGMARWLAVYRDLCFIRWANIRNEWYFHVIIGPIYPLAMLTFLKLTGAVRDPATALYMTAGNAIMALVLGPMQSLSNDLAWGRQRNDLDYYATLPFSKLQLILAFTTINSIFVLPAMAITIAIGKFWLGFPVSPHPLVILVMPLAALSLTGLGVCFGVHARNGHHANMLNTLTMLVVMFFSPVIIPEANLPLVLRYTSKLLPTSYAARAFRSALAGQAGLPVLTDVAVLALFAAALLYFATRKMDWRIE